jgi:hypothetical protein
MLGTKHVLFALSLLTAAAIGCGGGGNTTGTTGTGGSTGTGGHGGDTTSSTTTTTGTGGDMGTGGALTCLPGEGVTLAGTKLYFGEGNSGQWKQVGFNLDGLVSTSGSKDLCQPAEGAFTVTPYPDGDEGIDNSFGKNLLPQIIALYPTWVSDINAGISKGFFDVLLKMECLPPEGDVPVMVTKLFGGTTLGSAPKFDGTDKWPVAPELLADTNDPESSSIIFPKSSVIGTTFDAGPNETFILTVPINTMTASTSIKLTLYSAHTKMELAADRKSATKGMIGGVLNTEEFVAELKKVGTLLELCDSPIFAGLITQVRQSSDIMADGTQDPSKTCDGITMGLAFEMKEVQLGVVGPPTPVGMPCP